MATVERAIPVGGAALNFKVVGGVTAPLNPAENTVWVNTADEITGWVFAGKDPSAETVLVLTEASADAYLNASGTQAYHSNFTLTDYVELPAGTAKVTTNNTTDTSDFYHAFYDADKALISTVQRSAGEVSYDVPAGAVYMRLSLYDGDAREVAATIMPEEGLVWIQENKASAVQFNALKKNSIEVSPSGASQCISGAWVSKDVVVFQDGAWVSLMHAFLYGANQFEGLTGGWESNGTLSDAGVYLKASNSSSWTHYAYTKNAVDLTDVNSLIFDIVTLNNYSSTWVRCTVTATANDKSSYLARLVPTKKGVQTLDVSGISGKVFINIQAGNTSSVTVHSVTWE